MASKFSTIILIFSLLFFSAFSTASKVCKPKPNSPPPVSPPPKPKCPPPPSPPKPKNPPTASPPKPKSPPPASPSKPPSPPLASPPPASPPKPINPPPTSPSPASPPNPTTPPPASPSKPQCPPPASPPPVSPPPTTCPKDILKLGVCSDLLGNGNIVIGTPLSSKCCALIQGLDDMEAALCLCTAIKANVLGMNLNVPVTLSLILSACQKSVPSGFKCS